MSDPDRMRRKRARRRTMVHGESTRGTGDRVAGNSFSLTLRYMPNGPGDDSNFYKKI